MNNLGSNLDNEINNSEEGNAGAREILDESSSSTSYVAALNLLSSIITPRTCADETGNNFPIMYEYLKGSTCTFVESILRAYGFRTGLYTSPHLISICERYRLDGLKVSEEKFLNHFWWCWNRLKENSMEDIHFFRFLTLVAFKIFTEEKVDVAILEVGLGGKFDATNVVNSPVVCGISSLGYDHMEILGNTLTQIAREKAGIMKPGVPVFTVPQPEDARRVLEDVASELLVPLHVVSPLDPATLGGLNLGLAGDHQCINAGLAVALCCSWLRRTGHLEEFNPQESAIGEGYLPDSFVKGLVMANIEGRAQIIHDSYVKQRVQCNMEEAGNADFSELIFYLDGAHTPESMDTCAKWFSSAIKMDTKSHVQTREIHKETQNGFTEFISNFDHQQHSIKNSKMSSKQVLLFNCSSERDPQLLLSQLVNTCILHGVNFNRAIFVPSHSSFTQFVSSTSTRHDSTKVDLTWQLSLQRTWENVICGCREITKNDQEIGPRFSAMPPCDFFLSEPSMENTKDHLISAVLPSVPLTIKWLRECVGQSHSLRLQVLVTGSLHLIGDVLRTLKE
ncbi:folylpolyglutamate synthase isoform X2 [Cryptomeria japonica]|uniref:folylpolyglutamate synthase isoform X2 n=1 Tax=Cryptomeria japonica TaxID=3369 RepID=UPI0025ABB0CC|nr:folylpolyglutamate synthase isoform X2 [Cryptomeria japonica]